MMSKRQEMLSWSDFARLIDYLVPQFNKTYTCILMVNQGGIIPGAMLAEAMEIKQLYLVSVNFPMDNQLNPHNSFSIELPLFSQFPEINLLKRQPLLLVAEHWHSGREMMACLARLEREGLAADTAVLHFDSSKNRFEGNEPTYCATRTRAHIIYPWQGTTGFLPKLITPIR